MTKFSLKFVILVEGRKFGHLSTKITLTLARIEINDFWDKILKALNLRIQDLVSELIYLDSNSRYLFCTDLSSNVRFGKVDRRLFYTLAP